MILLLLAGCACGGGIWSTGTGGRTSSCQDLETAQPKMVARYGPRRRCVIAAGMSVSWAAQSAPVVGRGPAAAGTVEVAEVLHGWPLQLPPSCIAGECAVCARRTEGGRIRQRW
jgi:hypothetical protein